MNEKLYDEYLNDTAGNKQSICGECGEDRTYAEWLEGKLTSHNSDYAKCAEAIYLSTLSSREVLTVDKIEQILKAHFANVV